MRLSFFLNFIAFCLIGFFGYSKLYFACVKITNFPEELALSSNDVLNSIFFDLYRLINGDFLEEEKRANLAKKTLLSCRGILNSLCEARLSFRVDGGEPLVFKLVNFHFLKKAIYEYHYKFDEEKFCLYKSIMNKVVNFTDVPALPDIKKFKKVIDAVCCLEYIPKNKSLFSLSKQCKEGFSIYNYLPNSGRFLAERENNEQHSSRLILGIILSHNYVIQDIIFKYHCLCCVRDLFDKIRKFEYSLGVKKKDLIVLLKENLACSLSEVVFGLHKESKRSLFYLLEEIE